MMHLTRYENESNPAIAAVAPGVSLRAYSATPPAAPIPVKVVVVAMFELGADTGDAPGEYQFWVEREHLDQTIPFPAGYHDLRMNSNGILAVLTGQGTAKAASTIMALGLDPRFDLSKAYWLVAGIAGADPDKATLGSAVWTDYVIDGDLDMKSTREKFQPTGRPAMFRWERNPFEAPASRRKVSSTDSIPRSRSGPTASPKTSPSATQRPSARGAPSSRRRLPKNRHR